MKRLVLVPLLLTSILLLAASAGLAQENPARGLFRSVGRPPFPKPIPANAAFATIDGPTFDRILSVGRGPLVLPDVPLTNVQRVTLELERFEVLAPGAQLLEGRSNGNRPFTPEASIFLRGKVEGAPGSFVYLAVFRYYCSGYIEMPGVHGAAGTRYTIAPLDLRDGSPSVMAVYDERTAISMQGPTFAEHGKWECGAEDVEGYQENVNKVFRDFSRREKGSDARIQSNTMLAAQLAIECDSLYYVMHARNLSRATNYALTVVGAMSAIYMRDVNVTFQVPYLRVWTGGDPWPGTTTSTLLPQFRTYYINNMGGVQRTLAQMFTGSSTGGGIAYLNTLCSTSFGYAVIGLDNNVTYPTSAYVWDTDVTSHETGHNFGSPHTHSCTWAPAIDSCYTAEGGCFPGTSPRAGTIMSYCHLTAFGTQLLFHPRVGALIRTGAEAATCFGALDASAANDLAVSDISVPAAGGAVGQSVQFTPRAYFRNAGTSAQLGASVNMTIRDSMGVSIYTNNQVIGSLAPGASIGVDFTTTSIATIGRYNVTVTVTLAGDAFQVNNTMVRPFEVTATVSGSVTVTAPNGGTTYRAGSVINITWTSTSVTTARIDFSPDDGATWYNVRSDISAAGGSLSWLVPAMATTTGRIRVANRDNLAVGDQSDNTFTIAELPLDWQWARSAGSTLNDDIHGVATDSRGNVYVCGTFNDTLWLDTVGIVSSGGSDGFVAKYTPGGWLLWAKRFGGTGNDTAHGVGVDASGNVFVTGSFFGTCAVGATNLNSAGDADVLIAKYDASGNVTWAIRAGSTGRDAGRALALDGSGNVYIAGAFANTVAFGATNLTASGLNDAFILRCTTGGTFDWAQRGGGANMDEALGVGVDATGNCAMVGRYTTSATFGATTVLGNGGDDGFVARYNSSGVLQWTNSVVGSGADDLRGVAVEGGGAVIVTGAITGTVNVGTRPLGAIGGRDVIVVKYSTSGAFQWMRRFGGTGDDFGTSVVLDAAGNSYIAGNFTTQMQVAEMTANASGGSGSDIFLTKVGPDGWPDWVRSGGGARNEEGYGVAVNTTGDAAYLVGRYPYTPPVDQNSIYGADALAGRGSNDLVIARLAMFGVTSPRTRDEWRISENRAITWTACPASNVKIEYSIDDGTTWTVITNSTANTGTYNWTVPSISAPRVMVRVTDIDNPAICGYAVSGTFRIVSVLPPTGLTATGRNGFVDLTWTAPIGITVSSYTIYRVALPGSVPSGLQLVTTVSGSQTTYADHGVNNCTDYVYGVKSVVGGTESVFSNLDTARPEAPRTMVPLNPLGDEKVKAGSTENLHWTSTGCIDSVRFELWTQRSGTWTPIVPTTPNDGDFTWSVPNVKSTYAMIRIIARNDGTVIGTTDTFSICSAASSIIPNGPTTFCQGDSVVLTAPADYKVYLWSTGATTRSITVRTAGTYLVSVADSADCAATSEGTLITVNPRPQPILTNTRGLSLCVGDSTVLDAGAGYSGYIWSNGATSRKITVKTGGSYWARVSSDAGCPGMSDTVSVSVTSSPHPSIASVGSTSICDGDSVVLDAGAGFAGYVWSNGATTRTIAVRTAGAYWARVASAGGCGGTSDTISVTVRSAPQASATSIGPTTFCEGDSVTLTVPSGFASYRWSTGATTPNIRVGQSGSYTVTVTNGTGCSATSTPIVVTVHAKPARPVIARNAKGDSLTYNGAVGTLVWTRNDTVLTGMTSGTIPVGAVGIYKVTVTDGNGCSNTSEQFEVLTLTLGITDAETGDHTLFLHPNPTSGLVTIETDMISPAPMRITVTDMSGRIVRTFETPNAVGHVARTIDLNALPSGVYIVNVEAGLRKWNRKVSKQ